MRVDSGVHPLSRQASSGDDGAAEVEVCLSHLANNRSVAINTQKTALNAVVFLYKQFLGRELGELKFNRTAKGRRLPTVFTHEEAVRVLSLMRGDHKLAASLMYGSGLCICPAHWRRSISMRR